MARQSAHADIAESVDRTLKDEARRSEMMLASVRAIALGPVFALNTVMYFVPALGGFSHVNLVLPLLALSWVVASLVLYAALRRGFYRAWMRVVVPLTDAILIWGTNYNAWHLAKD